MIRSYPKPQPKPKKVFDKKYWDSIRHKSREKKVKKDRELLDGLKKWRRDLYDKQKGICQESGRHLRFSIMFCCHVLPKSQYESFALDLRNGILLNAKYHDILDKGSPSQRKALHSWQAIRRIRKQLLAEIGEEYDEDYWLKITF